MSRSLLAIALASLCGISASTVIAQAGSPPALRANAVVAPQSRAEARDAVDAALAAAVIGAVTAQFDEPDVAVTLGRVTMQPASLQDRKLTGQGRLRLGDDPAWIPFGFEALYDTGTASVSYPHLVLGDGTAGRELSPASKLAHALQGRVRRDLRAEFQQQPVDVAVERVISHPAGRRFVHLKATGTVEFGAEGSAPARIDAIYDTRERRWIRVGYELAGEAGVGTEPATATGA